MSYDDDLTAEQAYNEEVIAQEVAARARERAKLVPVSPCPDLEGSGKEGIVA